MSRPASDRVPASVGQSVLRPLRPLRARSANAAVEGATGSEHRTPARERRHAAAALRAETILALYAEGGLTYAEIAAQVGVSCQRVHQVVDEALAEAGERRRELAEFALEREFRVIDATMREMYEIIQRKCDACEGDEKRRMQCTACRKTGYFYPVHHRFAAIDRYARGQERRIKLLRLDAPAQAQSEANPRRDLYAELEKLSDEQLDQKLTETLEPHTRRQRRWNYPVSVDT